MPNLREQLALCFQGRVCLMGLGNAEYGDDGFGVRLAEKLQDKFESRPRDVRVIAAGNAAEQFLGGCSEEGYDDFIFLDAVDFGGEPGAVVFLNSSEMAARFPQISTHKISLSLLAKWVEANGSTKAWLLGVQPQSLTPGQHLTAKVQRTFELLAALLGQARSHANVC